MCSGKLCHAKVVLNVSSPAAFFTSAGNHISDPILIVL